MFSLIPCEEQLCFPHLWLPGIDDSCFLLNNSWGSHLATMREKPGRIAKRSPQHPDILKLLEQSGTLPTLRLLVQ